MINLSVESEISVIELELTFVSLFEGILLFSKFVLSAVSNNLFLQCFQIFFVLQILGPD